MVFGTLDQALGAARRLHRRHAAITGVMTRAAGPFAAGSRYWANETSALRWVYATLVETSLIAHDLVLPPLSSEERARYYAESRLFAAMFGIAQASLPSSFGGFHCLQQGHVGIRDADRDPRSTGSRGAGSERDQGLHPPTQVVPCSDSRNAAAPAADSLQTALWRDRTAHRRICDRVDPARLFCPPRAAALCRSLPRGHGPALGKGATDLLNQWVNQLWIGQRALDNARREHVLDSYERPSSD